MDIKYISLEEDTIGQVGEIESQLFSWMACVEEITGEIVDPDDWVNDKIEDVIFVSSIDGSKKYLFVKK